MFTILLLKKINEKNLHTSLDNPHTPRDFRTHGEFFFSSIYSLLSRVAFPPHLLPFHFFEPGPQTLDELPGES